MSCMCFECVSERGLDNPPMPPHSWHIEKNPKPIADRRFDFDFWHDDYDGADGGNGLAGNAASWEDAVKQCWAIEPHITTKSAALLGVL
jgi:hypothetical protein